MDLVVPSLEGLHRNELSLRRRSRPAHAGRLSSAQDATRFWFRPGQALQNDFKSRQGPHAPEIHSGFFDPDPRMGSARLLDSV